MPLPKDTQQNIEANPYHCEIGPKSCFALITSFSDVPMIFDPKAIQNLAVIHFPESTQFRALEEAYHHDGRPVSTYDGGLGMTAWVDNLHHLEAVLEHNGWQSVVGFSAFTRTEMSNKKAMPFYGRIIAAPYNGELYELPAGQVYPLDFPQKLADPQSGVRLPENAVKIQDIREKYQVRRLIFKPGCVGRSPLEDWVREMNVQEQGVNHLIIINERVGQDQSVQWLVENNPSALENYLQKRFQAIFFREPSSSEKPVASLYVPKAKLKELMDSLQSVWYSKNLTLDDLQTSMDVKLNIIPFDTQGKTVADQEKDLHACRDSQNCLEFARLAPDHHDLLAPDYTIIYTYRDGGAWALKNDSDLNQRWDHLEQYLKRRFGDRIKVDRKKMCIFSCRNEDSRDNAGMIIGKKDSYNPDSQHIRVLSRHLDPDLKIWLKVVNVLDQEVKPSGWKRD